MSDSTREGRLVSTFVTLADTLVVGFDVVELLQTLVDTCTEVLETSAAGIVLAAPGGDLEVIATTSEQSRLVEMIQLSSGNGPCVEAFRTGESFALDDLSLVAERWPEFHASASEQGFAAVHAFPLRLRGNVLGALNLFYSAPRGLSAEDSSVAQGLADVATIGILQERAVRENAIARQQLQNALDSRVIIEQAKGVLAQVHTIDMDAAFTMLRSHARNSRLALREVAQGVVNRTIEI